MFEKIEYTVKRIDGDYAYLQNDAEPGEDEVVIIRLKLEQTA